MRVLPFLLVIFLLTSALAVPVPTSDLENGDEGLPALSDDWRIEVVGYHGGPPDIAIDSLNRPHVLHCPSGEVWLSIREGDGGWKSEFIAETVAGGVCGKLSLGPDGEPHITLPPRVGDPGQMYAFKQDGLWHFEPAPFPVGGLALDSGGVPYAVGIPGFPQQGLLFSHKVNLSWETELVDSFPASRMMAHWESLVVDSSNNPHILYYADTTGEVRYAHYDSGNWSVETVDDIGNICYVGRHGSVDLDSSGLQYAAFLSDVDWASNRSTLKLAKRHVPGWSVDIVDSGGMKGFFPTIKLDTEDKPRIGFQNWGQVGADLDLRYATWNDSWVFETVYDAPLLGVQFPDFELDACDNPHLAFYSNDDAAVMYATKGEPCPPEPEEASVSLDVDPDTLNLRSKGRWITAYLSTENASLFDIDISSILLQDTLPPERWDYQDDILMLKFNRQDLIAMLEVGESVEIKLSGKWKDGTAFEAYDYIRVIDPGKK